MTGGASVERIMDSSQAGSMGITDPGAEREERGGDVMADNAEAREKFLAAVDEIVAVPREASCVERLGCVA